MKHSALFVVEILWKIAHLLFIVVDITVKVDSRGLLTSMSKITHTLYSSGHTDITVKNNTLYSSGHTNITVEDSTPALYSSGHYCES
jgi:hypothetical protein